MLSKILAIIIAYKYLALFIITFLASLLNITPAMPILLVSGFLIRSKYLIASITWIVGYCGVVLGDLTAYFLSFCYGRDVLVKIGFRRMLNSPKFFKVEKIFNKHASIIIFLSRFLVPGVGPVVNLMAGLSKTDYRKFIVCDLLGEAIFISLLIGIGYLLADQWRGVANWLSIGSLVLLVIIIAMIIHYIWSK